MAALLSHRIVAGAVVAMSMPHSRACSQLHSFVASNPVMYSAFQDDAATVFCLCAFHEKTPDPSEKAQLVRPVRICETKKVDIRDTQM